MQANATSDSLVSHINLLPTILDYMSVDTGAPLEGKSLLPLFKNPQSEVDEEIFMEFGRYEVDLDWMNETRDPFRGYH